MTVVTTIMLCYTYVVGKLFSKVEHIELSAVCDYFKGFIAKKTTLQLKINVYKES